MRPHADGEKLLSACQERALAGEAKVAQLLLDRRARHGHFFKAERMCRLDAGSHPSSGRNACQERPLLPVPRSRMPVSPRDRQLLGRGLALEVLTLGWNVVGVGLLGIAAVQAHSVALAGFGFDSLIELFASMVVMWHLNGTGHAHEGLAVRLIGAASAALCVYLRPDGVVPGGGWTVSILSSRHLLAGVDGQRAAGLGESGHRTAVEHSSAAGGVPRHHDGRVSRGSGASWGGTQCRVRLVVGRSACRTEYRDRWRA